MERKKWLAYLSGTTFIVLLSWFSGCGGKSEDQKPGNNDGVSCAQFNNDQEGCKKAKEKGKQCVFDEDAKTCSLPPSDDDQTECSKKKPDECKDSDQCTFDVADATCKDAEAGIKGTCASLQRDAACTAKNGCEWDGDTCIEKQNPTDIFTWTKASLPAGAVNAEISQVVVSGDEAHLYAFSNKADGTAGLYHSSDDGATWLRVGKAADGVLKAMPSLGSVLNPDEASLDTKANEPVIKATQTGVVVHSGKKLFILEGGDVKWGIDTATHYQAILNPRNSTKDIKNQNIVFVDIITTQAGQTVVFGQESANTVFFKDAAGAVSKGSEPKRFKTLTTAGAGLDQVWLRAGNTHNNAHILLASAQGIWQFPVHHTNLINAGTYGKVGQDERVLFPEADAHGVNWKDNNVSFNVIGSFDNGGTHHYFAGLTHNAGAITGGFAHFNGVQAAGQHAFLNFNDSTVFGVSRNGPMRLITSAGLKGINNDGSANPARDYSFATLAANKAEMMGDASAVNEPEATDDARARLFGNTNKTIWWLLDKGIFVRIKSQGQSRP